MKCPTCPDVKLLMTDRKGIEIDYCPDCRGVWLDRGELDKLIEKSSSSATVSQYQPVQLRSDHEDEERDRPYKKGYYKKRKSFLSEIFD